MMVILLSILISQTPTGPQVTLAWDDGAPGVTEWFQVYRAPSPEGPWVKAGAWTPAGETRFTDRSVVNGVTYYYSVTAGVQALESPRSDVVEARIPGRDSLSPVVQVLEK